MEIKKASYNYSLKNIPIPNRDAYMRGIIQKAEDFLQRVRWKVFFFENPSDKIKKKTYGFNSTRNAPQSKLLINFEHDLTHLISNLDYSDKLSPLQKQLMKDTKKIRNSKNIFVSADKTNNVYQVDKATYNKLMRDSVTAHYEKTEINTESSINLGAKQITEDLEISDRVEPIAHRNAYITLKDHKENFPNNIKCRLINPTKSSVGKISQQLLQNINEQIRSELKLQQWRSTSDTLNWFKNLKHKTRLKFIQLDIVDFYPSITEDLYNLVLDWAADIVPISIKTRAILNNARQSILFHNNTTWKKITGLFDVTMGSYDGCELCELVGLYVLNKVKQKFPDINFGLYRDDGLGVLKRTPKNKLEKLKKDLFKIFKDEFSLNITLDTDLTTVHFLDVTFDLHKHKYNPFRKPNDHPMYIHKDSNHPPHVAKQLPKAISKRLNEISCDKESFDNSKTEYEKALSESNLLSKLTYDPLILNNGTNATKRKRCRNIIWFTPPYNASLKTNIGNKFLQLIDKHFPINNPLHKILNRKTVKLSYSCTPNVHSIMQTHNRKILSAEKTDESARCNCQNKASCPTPGECCRTKVVYQATVKNENGSSAEYIGCTEPAFKLRYGNHKKSFRLEKYKSETTLSKYVWDQRLNPNPSITFKFLKKCDVYETGNKACDLCLSEKFQIIKNLHKANLINKRTDIGNKCPHKRKKTLKYLM